MDVMVNRLMSFTGTASLNQALSNDSQNQLVKPGLKQIYDINEESQLITDICSKKAHKVFKLEFTGMRIVWITAKYYIVLNEINRQASYKDVSKKKNNKNIRLYKNVPEISAKL